MTHADTYPVLLACLICALPSLLAVSEANHLVLSSIVLSCRLGGRHSPKCVSWAAASALRGRPALLSSCETTRRTQQSRISDPDRSRWHHVFYHRANFLFPIKTPPPGFLPAAVASWSRTSSPDISALRCVPFPNTHVYPSFLSFLGGGMSLLIFAPRPPPPNEFPLSRRSCWLRNPGSGVAHQNASLDRWFSSAPGSFSCTQGRLPRLGAVDLFAAASGEQAQKN